VNQPAVFENICFILVQTLHSGNIGSAARALKNMGLHRLKLVNPCDPANRECQMMAVGANDVVENAPRYSVLEEAVADEHVVIGTTSNRGRRQKTRIYTPREVAPLICQYAESQRVCLVFGPERRGLSEQQLALCRYLVTIPASPLFPTLNLAQAVMLMAYEIFSLSETERTPPPELATEEERSRMFRHMERVLLEIGFLSRSNPGHMMRAIRRILGQADLTERDVRILRGIMSQMEWYVRSGKNLDRKDILKP
jgi:TrmH family RNA methyltransferase